MCACNSKGASRLRELEEHFSRYQSALLDGGSFSGLSQKALRRDLY